MKSDGSDQRAITSSSCYDHGPTFVNEHRIVFARNVLKYGTSAELFYVDLQTAEQGPLSESGVRGYQASRIDGDRIIFTRFNGQTDQLWTFDVSIKLEQRLFHHHGSSPAVSPKGDQCVFLQDRGEQHYDIRLYDFTTKELRWLTKSNVYKTYPSFVNEDRILFVTEPTANGVGTLRMLNLKSGDVDELFQVR